MYWLFVLVMMLISCVSCGHEHDRLEVQSEYQESMARYIRNAPNTGKLDLLVSIETKELR